MVLLLLAGCGRVPIVVRGDAGLDRIDSGVPDAGHARCDEAPFGVDCCVSGQRVSSSRCENGAQTCDTGEICACGGAAQRFNCVDFCGTDAVTSPECVSGQWQCASGLIDSAQCPAGTCWGEPGDCCVNPSCVEGAWSCESLSC
jgi:hypothetical protein